MSGKDARRVLGSVTKSQAPTAEELKQCQKHAKVEIPPPPVVYIYRGVITYKLLPLDIVWSVSYDAVR